MNIFGVVLVFSFVFLLVGGFKFRAGKEGQRQASFERFNSTCGGRRAPMIFSYDGLICDGGKLWMNCTTNVKEDIFEEPKLSIELEKCKNVENLDTCEHFYTYKSEKYCTIVDTDNAIWSPFYNAFKPKFNCPFRKGIYRAVNGLIDMQALLLFPLDSWSWRAKILLNDKITERIIMCLLVEVHIGKTI